MASQLSSNPKVRFDLLMKVLQRDTVHFKSKTILNTRTPVDTPYGRIQTADAEQFNCSCKAQGT